MWGVGGQNKSHSLEFYPPRGSINTRLLNNQIQILEELAQI